MNIYIANLSANTSSADFWEKFSHIGIVKQVVIMRSPEAEAGKDFVVIDIEAFPKMKWKEIFDQQLQAQKVRQSV